MLRCNLLIVTSTIFCWFKIHVNVSENGVCPVCPTNCHFKGGVMIKVLDFGGPYFRQTHVCWLKHVITPFSMV